MTLTRHLSLALVALIPALAIAQSAAVSDADAQAIARTVGEQLHAAYPFPDIAERYAKALTAKAKAGAYRGLDDCALATHMTDDLHAVHQDVHLRIFCDSVLSKKLAPKTDAAGVPKMKDLGFESVELDMDLSTAYIRSQGGWRANADTFRTAAAAMNLASQAKYVIIDLRGNPGGNGEVGRFLASYFYPDGEEKYYLYGFEKDREHNQQEWTYAFVPGPRLPDAKLYILVNKKTASATEGFAYAMQQLKRATIVGQTTAGAGIAGDFRPLPNKMTVFLPVKMIVAPHSSEGWEGKGVVPDVSTEPDAERAAVMELIRKDMAQPPAAAAASAG